MDGVALLQRRRTHAADPFAGCDPAPTPEDAPALRAELERLADLYDAVADVMVAEAVHQNVVGNAERSGAVLAAIDHQGLVPRLDFPRTPHAGKSLTHRVLCLLGDETLPPGWPVDPRAHAEPRLNTWIGRVLGDPLGWWWRRRRRRTRASSVCR